MAHRRRRRCQVVSSPSTQPIARQRRMTTISGVYQLPMIQWTRTGSRLRKAKRTASPPRTTPAISYGDLPVVLVMIRSSGAGRTSGRGQPARRPQVTLAQVRVRQPNPTAAEHGQVDLGCSEMAEIGRSSREIDAATD